MDYLTMLEGWRKVGEVHSMNRKSGVPQSFRTVVIEPDDYEEDMAALAAIESRISAMVAEGVITGFESLRLTREIPEMRKRLKATRRVFRVKVRAPKEEQQ